MLENSTKVNQSKPPLRWIANIFGDIGAWAIGHVADLDDQENFGWRYKAYYKIYAIFMPTYYKYGTHYILEILKDIDMSGPGWNDYDENGVPYWEKTGTVDTEYNQPWKFVDPWTGDAFRVINK